MLKQSWQTEDGSLLKKLRESANIDIHFLAQIYCISASQITQLEEGGDRGFYSPDIKFSLGSKLLLHFGYHIKTIPIIPFFDPLLIIKDQSIININSFWRLQFIWLTNLLKITDVANKDVGKDKEDLKV
jgi:transcriptional regulator with XRE-family HTH domain